MEAGLCLVQNEIAIRGKQLSFHDWSEPDKAQALFLADYPDSWAAALPGIDAIYLTYSPDLAIPGARERVEDARGQVQKGVERGKSAHPQKLWVSNTQLLVGIAQRLNPRQGLQVETAIAQCASMVVQDLGPGVEGAQLSRWGLRIIIAFFQPGESGLASLDIARTCSHGHHVEPV